MGIEALIIASIVSTIAQVALADSGSGPGTPEPPAEIGNEGAIRAEKEAEMRRRRQARGGRASTIMTGTPLGAGAPAPVGKKYLTGA